jgi:peptidoglycan/xylan/chitin deacetylase (PgdA/CDA1 family)
MNQTPNHLDVIAYHYVRDLARTPFPRLKAMDAAAFRDQIDELGERFEFATLESALAFLAGDYRPARDLCLLTFDDGVRDHYEEVFPYLNARRIQGVFFLVTSCLEGRVAAVHKNHFLMAALDFSDYRHRFLSRLQAEHPSDLRVDAARARATYRWDSDEVAEFKYLLNFLLPDRVRDAMLDVVFTECLGGEEEFSRQLYLSWDEARTLQQNGMIVGGHTHTHAALSRLRPEEQAHELHVSTSLLRERLEPQTVWPFSYPYGKDDSFDAGTVEHLQQLGYSCAFTTVPGRNSSPAPDVFRIRRIDPKEVGAVRRTAALRPAPGPSSLLHTS